MSKDRRIENNPDNSQENKIFRAPIEYSPEHEKRIHEWIIKQKFKALKESKSGKGKSDGPKPKSD
ncbi:hypothetical protein [uncultured Ferrimonas sp.]|uniref:hypothetical protein n=1 Tax=uncultured Ferrimonas sp. TaxID=432640 RepID=UPI0026383908|nr:hypothetical protein [uncultured Ferrimonas sp.]